MNVLLYVFFQIDLTKIEKPEPCVGRQHGDGRREVTGSTSGMSHIPCLFIVFLDSQIGT